MRTDLNPLASYGYRDILDKAGLDFFSGEFQDQVTLASTPGEGETGVDQFGDNAGQTLPITEASLALGRQRVSAMGMGGMPEQSALETGAMLAGTMRPGLGDGGSAYADLVASSLEAAGYNPTGVTADEIASQLGISSEAARLAISGQGDPALIDAVIAAHSQLLEDRNAAISGSPTGPKPGYL